MRNKITKTKVKRTLGAAKKANATNAFLQKYSEKLAQLENLYPLPQSVQLMNYLAAVYAFARSRKLKNYPKRRRALAEATTIQRNSGGDVDRYHAVLAITASGDADKGVLWRYARILNFAASQKVEPKDLSEFIARNGGIIKCASLAGKSLRSIKSKPKLRVKSPKVKDPVEDDWD